MANKKITDLPSISAPLKGTDLWEVSIDDGASFSSHQATGDELKALLSLGGDQYTFVKADGVTPTVNGQQFLDGYNTAIDKLIDTETPQTLILAPGTYVLSQDFNIPDGLSIVSLTGERDAVIDMAGYIFMIQDGTTKLKGLSLIESYSNVYYNGYGTSNCVIDNCAINAFIAWTQNIPFYGTIKNSIVNNVYAPFSGTMLNIEYCGIVYTDNATGYGLYLAPYLDGVFVDDSFYCNGSYDIVFTPTILNSQGRFFDQVDITTVLGYATFKNITSFSMSGCSISGNILLENCVGDQRVFEGIAFSNYFASTINLKVINCHQTSADGGFLISHNNYSFDPINIEFRDCTARGSAFNFNYTSTNINGYNVLVDNCNVAVGTANCFNHIIEDSAVITVNNITFRDCTTDASNSFNTTSNNTGNLFIYNQNFINCTAGSNSFLYVSGFNGMGFRVYDVSFEGCTATDNSFITLDNINYSRIDRINIDNCTSGDYSFISTNDNSSSGFTLESSSADNCFISNCTAGANSFLNFRTQGNVTIDSSSVFNISNCTAENKSFYYIEDIAVSGSHFMYIIAKFNNCTASNNSFGSINSSFGSCNIIHSGPTTYTHCTGGDNSFMGNVYATLTNCRAENNSFGSVYPYTNMNGTAAGTFENCTGNSNCFAGSNVDDAPNQPTATGVFKYCTAFNISFGSYDGLTTGNTTASGTFQWCNTGDVPFGTTFASGLNGGGSLFWCQTYGAVGNVAWANEHYNN
jgi:hypothetical protein